MVEAGAEEVGVDELEVGEVGAAMEVGDESGF